MASQNIMKHYNFKSKQISKPVNCIKLHLIIIVLYIFRNKNNPRMLTWRERESAVMHKY